MTNIMENSINDPSIIQGFIKCSFDTLKGSVGFPISITDTRAEWGFKFGEHRVKLLGKVTDGSIYDNMEWTVYGDEETNEAFESLRQCLNAEIGESGKYIIRYEIARHF